MKDKIKKGIYLLRRNYFLHKAKLYSHIFPLFPNLLYKLFRKKEPKTIKAAFVAKSKNFTLLSNSNLTLKKNLKGEIDYSSIYPCSDDVFKLKEDYERPQLFLGIGNLTSLDIVSNLNPEILFFVDVNASQLKYIELIIKLILKCKNRAEFLSFLFGKKLVEISKVLKEADIEKDLLSVEDKFWRCVDRRRSVNEMHDELLKYEIIEEDGVCKGILSNFGTNVFGRIRVIPTFILNDEKQIKSIREPFDEFPIYRKNGFLSSESKYKRLQNVLSDKPYVLIHGQLSSDLIFIIANEFRYHKIYLWLSNLLSFFRPPSDIYRLIVRILHLRLEHNITILEDQRKPFFKRIYKWKPISHWDAFRKVLKYIDGKCLEIVNVKKWAEEKTTLPNTFRKYYTDFLSDKENYRCIFIHILIGHGMDIENYKQIVNEAFRRSRRVIILEHNRKSKDFLNKNTGITSEELIKFFGKPISLEYSMGIKSNNRNIIMVYDHTRKNNLI